MSAIIPRKSRRPRRPRRPPPESGAAIVDLQERLRRLDHRLDERLAGRPEGEAEHGRASLFAALVELAREAHLDEALARLRNFGSSERADDFGLDPAFEEAVAPFFELLYHRWWRVEARGLERIPATGPAIVVANHSGGMLPWDGAMLKVALKREHPAHRELRPLIDDFAAALPFVGSWMGRLGAVRACRENAEQLLARGEIVGVFPEGIRGIGKPYEKRYRLERFGRGGFVIVAAHARVPIVPVAIVGAEEIHPMIGKIEGPARLFGIPYFPITPTFPWLGLLGLVPLPTKWTIAVGEPIEVASRFDPEGPPDPAEVERVTEEVRATVQSMIDAALRERESIFF